MTDRRGRYWTQPERSEILLDSTYALMTMATFKKLLTYSTTLPSGTYTGKMWKRRIPWQGEPAKWFLNWYGAIEGPDILIHAREILFV